MNTITRRDFFLRTGATTGILFLAGCDLTGGMSTLIAALLDVDKSIQAALPILTTILPAPYNLVVQFVGVFLNVLASTVGNTASIMTQQIQALIQVQKMEAKWAALKLDPALADKLPDEPLSPLIQKSPRQLFLDAQNSTNFFLVTLAMQYPEIQTSPRDGNAILALKVPQYIHDNLAKYSEPLPSRPLPFQNPPRKYTFYDFWIETPARSFARRF